MKINHNVSAFVANANLLKNEDRLTGSLERLSSGYRINHASDDAPGMALSSKMKSQIAALDQASRNSSDGISVIETAEGALKEVTSLIQRMRELSVQAANDTNTQEDVAAIQAEIKQLTDEIDRVSRDTEFNKMPLLNGSLTTRVYPNTRDVSLIQTSEDIIPGIYNFQLESDALQAVAKGTSVAGTVLDTYIDPATGQRSIPKGVVSINGVDVKFKGGESELEIYEALRNASEEAEINLIPYDPAVTVGNAQIAQHPETAGYVAVAGGYQYGTALAFVSEDYGNMTQIEIQCDNADLATFLGLSTTPITGVGKDVSVKLNGPEFTNQATVRGEGRTVTITDREGFAISYDVKEGSYANTLEAALAVNPSVDPATVFEDIALQVTDIGTMTLQVGANEHQTIEVDIPDMSSKALRLDDLDVTTVNGPDKAMAALDKALARVSSVRSKLGANENRLNYAIDNLDATSENVSAALSRIEDVDMAEEMSTYTQMNVLTQAATSVLAQANDIPEQTLQLLK